MFSDKRVVQIFRRAVNKAKNINRLAKTRSSVEGFFASKGAAYAIPDGDFARKASLKGGELQSHLQGMVNLIRDEDTMRLVVKVESEAKYTRYLCIVTTYGLSDEEESVVLGFDWVDEGVSLGLVIPLWSNVKTKLDGDGGFEIKTEHRNYIFKPVSVQTLWTALLWIHKCIKTAHRAKHFNGGLSHAWLDYYQNRISSPRECVNFWESMDELEMKRDIDLSCFEKVKTDEELLKGSIRNKLKEILTRFDLEEVTCRQVREALEAEMKMSLQHLKGYVDEQLFVILGQMESSSKITEHLFLGSEWNACNLQELKDNGVGYILNITKEVDNFFPGTFEYMNIRLYDIKEVDLMRHWGKTYRFIHKAKEHGSAVLVHCRRGISRSASTVIAYLMKEDNMSLSDAMKHVKSRRSIVQPNSGFWRQLIIYEGILKSSRNRHSSLFRRRSNSDSCNNRSRPHKKGRHKNTADHVDNTPEHAHTLPRMSNEALPEGEGENVDEEEGGAHPCEAINDWDEDEPQDSVSSESSNSDEETSKTRHKIRRTVSEPVMKSADDVMLTSPASRKPRARTFADRQANDVVRSHTSISEDNEESDGIDMDKEAEEMLEPQEAEAEVSLVNECLVQESEAEVPSEVKTCVTEENVENINRQSPEANDKTETGDDDTTNAEQLTGTAELEASELSCDAAKQVLCEESPRVDSSREDVASPREDVDSPREDVDSPREDVDSPREESPREGDGDYETSPRTPRQRSRSIGEKLEDKLLVKQGRCDSSENLKKVKLRGRVKRRERKAKSDLQLSSSGFVKRHTQIIEEQMLYSLLNNSEQTLATLATDFWETGHPVVRKENFCEAPKNSEVESDLGVVISVTDSENSSEKDVNVFEKNFEKRSDEDYAKSSECSSDKNDEQSSEKMNEKYSQSENTCEQTSTQSLDKNSQTNSENCCGKKRRSAPAELETIVQEVNAEAKRDIQTLGDVTKAPVISQGKLRHTGGNDDVCIDEMTWIDLTHHHGDVVKRRSAAFENVSANTESCRQGTGASLQQTVVVSRDEHAQNTCQDRAQGTHVDDSGFVGTNMDIPKLDLGDLENGEPLMRSNSIIVEDYNSWESSSVRDRTKILENIIAKTGGSFPSPRSRVAQKKLSDSQVEVKLEQDMNELDINTRAKPEEDLHGEDRPLSSSLGATSEQPAEDDVFGDAPVRSLVDKFEKNGGSE